MLFKTSSFICSRFLFPKLNGWWIRVLALSHRFPFLPTISISPYRYLIFPLILKLFQFQVNETLFWFPLVFNQNGEEDSIFGQNTSSKVSIPLLLTVFTPYAEWTTKRIVLGAIISPLYWVYYIGVRDKLWQHRLTIKKSKWHCLEAKPERFLWALASFTRLCCLSSFKYPLRICLKARCDNQYQMRRMDFAW